MATGSGHTVLDHLQRIALRQRDAGLTDGELLTRYLARRDEAAFEALVRRHGPMVLGVGRRVLRCEADVEDAFQATFLVLVRKAASVVPREKVASFLYGVAYHTALKVRDAAVRRRVKERLAGEMHRPEAGGEEWRRLLPLLDQELHRMPDKYRVPIVLCDLEGKTHKEAARQLGWPQGTLSGRLSRAHVQLARRLARHGPAPSGGALAAALAAAGVPATLTTATVKAAAPDSPSPTRARIPMLELRDVSKSFGGTLVLRPTTLAVEPGRTTVLIGPSGCGKSTLLRIMVGLIPPDAGSVRFEGEEVTPANAMALRRRMGFVLQDGGLFPHLTARANVGLLPRFLGWDAVRADRRIGELSELVRLPAGAVDRYPGQLSGGQRQRVGIMRALMLDPPVLLLDEPMGALDPLVRFDLQEDLRRIFQSLSKTVVLVTHDLAEAGFFGDHVVLINEGRIVQQGTLDDLARAPAEPFVTRFLSAYRLHVQPDRKENL